MDLDKRISDMIVTLVDIWFSSDKENDSMEKIIRDLILIRSELNEISKHTKTM